MTTTDWARVLRIAEEAWALPADARGAFLADVIANEPDLEEPLGKVLAADEDVSSDFLTPSGGLEFVLDAEIPERLGPYAIRREVGRGGMGAVFIAERVDGRFERTVALKVLASPLATEVERESFKNEVDLLARLEHPNIARLYDAGVEGQTPYLVMEQVDGLRIDDFADTGSLGAIERVRFFEAVCEAVQHAHQKLIVHRDLKPSNILVTHDGAVKLLDFGIAGIVTGSDEAVDGADRAMTPAYASPEQRRGEPVTTASDVYSLGVVLHELLTGGRPEVSLSLHTVPRSLRGDLEAILGRALSPSADARYPSAQALLDDLVRFRKVEPIGARPATRGYVVGRFVKRHRTAVLLTLGLGSGVLAGTAGAVWQGRVAAVERDRAERAAARAEEVTTFLTSVFDVSAPGDGPPADEIPARQILDMGAARIETELAADPLLQADMMSVLGEVYRGLAVDSVAETLLVSALDRRRAQLGDDHPEVLSARLALGKLYTHRHDRTTAHEREAVALLSDVVDRARDRADTRALLAQGLNQLGATDLVFGEADAAGALGRLHEARSIAESFDDPDILGQALHHLGWWHMRASEPDEAESYFHGALAIFSERWGETSPVTLATVSQLGWFYEGLGRYEEAADYLGRAVDARRSVYGDDHPRLANSLTGLGLVKLRSGRFEEAERDFRESLGVLDDFASDSAQASTRSWLAQALAGQGRVEEARSVFEEALDVAESGPRGRTLNDYAVFLRDRGEIGQAEARFREAWLVYEETIGPDHPFTGMVLGNLGSALSAQGKHAEATARLSQAVAVIEASRGPHDVSLVSTLVSLGWSHVLQGNRDEAFRNLERAHTIAVASYPADHWRVGHAKLYYGIALRAVQDYAEAEAVLLDSRAVLEPMRQGRAEDWYWVNVHLSELFAGLGREDEAARYRETAGAGSG